MKKNFRRLFLQIALVTLFVMVSSVTWAGGALIINIQGSPVLWDASATNKITVHPESGSCGQFNSTAMATRLATNLESWTTLSTVDLGFTILTGSVGSVDGNNYTSFLAGVNGNTTTQSSQNVQDGINPILYDDTGAIIDGATGENNGRFTILGFANPAGFSTDSSNSSLYTAIVDGQAVFNCYCLDDGSGNPANSDCTSTFSTNDLDFTMIHELGHFLNLDHSQINASLVGDGDDSNDDDLPTMYPVSVSAANQKTPMEDDIVALSSLYPNSNFFTSGDSSSTYCKVTGTLLDRNGTDMRCVDLQFISDDNSFNTAFVSGAYAVASDSNSDNDTADSGECTSGCGGFTMYLRPGRSYTLVANQISSSFTGGSGISPCANSQLSACSTSNITACSDGDSSTSCSACVVTETLSTNGSSENIASKIASECTAGATVALGNITSSSIAGDGSSGTSSGTGTSSGGTTSSSTSITACSLGQSGDLSSGLVFILALPIFGLILLRKRHV